LNLFELFTYLNESSFRHFGTKLEKRKEERKKIDRESRETQHDTEKRAAAMPPVATRPSHEKKISVFKTYLTVKLTFLYICVSRGPGKTIFNWIFERRQKISTNYANFKCRVARRFLFEPKNPNSGKFRRALHWKMLIYFMVISNILQTFGIFYDHLVHFCGFGIMDQEKSGNPDFLARNSQP
jgi:hypothetical protein